MTKKIGMLYRFNKDRTADTYNLYIFDHLPDAAGTDTGAETAADAEVLVNHVFI